MKPSVRLPVLLLLGGVCASSQAQIYKCKQAMGSVLYSDSPCNADAATVAIMPKGTLQFEPVPPSDAAVKEELDRLSGQEDDLVDELDAARAHSSGNVAEASALEMQIQALLESVRRQKNALLGRGLAPEKGEELVVESIK